jgi:hypothetical protein
MTLALLIQLDLQALAFCFLSEAWAQVSESRQALPDVQQLPKQRLNVGWNELLLSPQQW